MTLQDFTKSKTLLASLFLLVVTNTAFLWEQIPGLEEFLVFMVLSLVYLILLVTLGLKLGTMALERFKNKAGLVRWILSASILAFVFIFPSGVYYPVILGDEPTLTVQNEGAANCQTHIYFLPGDQFVKRSVCFGIERQKGQYRVKGDSVFLMYDGLDDKKEIGILGWNQDGEPESMRYTAAGQEYSSWMAVVQWDSSWNRPVEPTEYESSSLVEEVAPEELSYMEYWHNRVAPTNEWAKGLDSLLIQNALKAQEMGSDSKMALRYQLDEKSVKWVVYDLETEDEGISIFYEIDGELKLALERSFESMASKAPKSKGNWDLFDVGLPDSLQMEWMEDRFYFEADSLIYLYNNQDCGSPNAPEFMQEEQSRMLQQFAHWKALQQ
ncbi:hypothetical protein KFE98_19975 [bacterium SCSIO 12741]|nr:hypothetical protein KFE98_19975 [bacterium SCSIO 12741]